MRVLWLAGPIIVAMSLAGASRAQTALLWDDFDRECAGAFPKHWKLIYEGAGRSLQVLDTAEAWSKPNALRLVSASCGVAEAFHPATFPAPVPGANQHVRISARVFVGGVPSGGCNPNAAGLALCNPNFATFGTFYATIYLTERHGITVGPSFEGSPPQIPVTQKYSYGLWHKLLIDADLTAKTADYYVDYRRIANRIAFAGLGTPSGICVDSGDSGPNTTAWFDNFDSTVRSTVVPKLSSGAPDSYRDIYRVLTTGFRGGDPPSATPVKRGARRQSGWSERQLDGLWLGSAGGRA